MLTLKGNIRGSTAQVVTCALLSSAFLFISATAFGQSSADTLTYTVKPGDNLSKISKRLGNVNFWRFLFEDNKKLIADPDFIYPDQVLLIPSSITLSEEVVETLKKETQANSSHLTKEIDTEVSMETPQDSARAVQQFRKVFEQVVDQKEREKKEEDFATNALELGGLVINKTKSRMGSEFFYAFNGSWRYPAESMNYMLEIAEQPVPSMGAIIVIKIDNQQVFTTRLQPRASMDKMVNHAIYMCLKYLNNQVSSTKINIY